MGSECNPIKRHYDLSMSRRTRKSFKFEETDHQQAVIEDEHAANHRSLQELIIREEEMEVIESAGGNTLGKKDLQNEEKQLQIVTVQHGRGAGGVKLGKMMGRYMKAFNHLIRPKKDHRLASLWKKTALNYVGVNY